MSLMPQKTFSSFWRSRSSLAPSFLLRVARVPSSAMRSRSLSRATLPRMVLKLVSIPPSQRSVTKYWPARVASSPMMSLACFLVPT